MLQETSIEFRRNRNQWIDCKDKRGRTPLIISASRGYYQIVELFIQLGASIDVMDNFGCTALHGAVYYRQDAVAVMLINQGSSPFVENMQGITPMDIVCKYGHNARLLRQIEDRAIYCGWVEQKIRKLGIAYEWCRRWIVIAQRLSFPRHDGIHSQPNIRTVLLSYHSLDSVTPACKCWLDQAFASSEEASYQQVLRNRKMLHAIRVYLGRGHPQVRGAATNKTSGRITMYFRPVDMNENSIVAVSDLESYVNWASGLNSEEPTVPVTSPVTREPRPHWALEPPQVLQIGSESITEGRISTSSVEERAESSAVPESRQEEATENARQGLEKECLICMDNKIEVVFCHQNETYVSDTI